MPFQNFDIVIGKVTNMFTGLLITFFQWIFTSLAAYPSQYSSNGKYNLRTPDVPISKWAFMAAMHFGVNMLNNWAFAYNISVPVHIILRSFGSVTTMLAGFLRGKRYSILQVLSVILLTIGVLISAWADSESKACILKHLRVFVADENLRVKRSQQIQVNRPRTSRMAS